MFFLIQLFILLFVHFSCLNANYYHSVLQDPALFVFITSCLDRGCSVILILHTSWSFDEAASIVPLLLLIHSQQSFDNEQCNRWTIYLRCDLAL